MSINRVHKLFHHKEKGTSGLIDLQLDMYGNTDDGQIEYRACGHPRNRDTNDEEV